MRCRALSVAAFAAVVPATAFGQAWVPPRGEIFVGLSYQWLKADNHLFSDAVLGAERTPFEELIGQDLQTTSTEDAQIRSQVLILDADFGLTERLAVSGGIAFVHSQYLGPSPEDPVFDDGAYHGSFQDARIGARYAVLDGQKGSWVLTPFASFLFPAADYPVLAHAAVGRGLKELQAGVSAGRVLNLGGEPRAFVEGQYFYAFMEDPGDISLARSNVDFSFGYLHRSMTIQVFAAYQNTHGGVDWVQHLSLHDPNLGELVNAHDQAAAADHWRFGGGVSFQVSDAIDITVALNDTVWGVNTHDARTLTFGMSWGFRAFGGIGRTSAARDDSSEKN